MHNDRRHGCRLVLCIARGTVIMREPQRQTLGVSRFRATFDLISTTPTVTGPFTPCFRHITKSGMKKGKNPKIVVSKEKPQQHRKVPSETGYTPWLLRRVPYDYWQLSECSAKALGTTS